MMAPGHASLQMSRVGYLLINPTMAWDLGIQRIITPNTVCSAKEEARLSVPLADEAWLAGPR